MTRFANTLGNPAFDGCWVLEIDFLDAIKNKCVAGRLLCYHAVDVNQLVPVSDVEVVGEPESFEQRSIPRPISSQNIGIFFISGAFNNGGFDTAQIVTRTVVIYDIAKTLLEEHTSAEAGVRFYQATRSDSHVIKMWYFYTFIMDELNARRPDDNKFKYMEIVVVVPSSKIDKYASPKGWSIVGDRQSAATLRSSTSPPYSAPKLLPVYDLIYKTFGWVRAS